MMLSGYVGKVHAYRIILEGYTSSGFGARLILFMNMDTDFGP